MSAPYEVLAAAGLTAYVAAANTVKPNVDTAPPVAWTKLGANGVMNYDDTGVSVKHVESLKGFTPVGATAPIKIWRDTEGLNVEFTINDLTAEMYAKVMNGAAITTVASSTGIPGSKSIPLYQGHEVTLFALLLRGNVSPYGDGMSMQYWLPVVAQSEAPNPVFKKADPAGLKTSWMSIYDITNGFGKYEPQTALAS